MSEPVKTGKKVSATQLILVFGILLILIAIAVVGWLVLKDKDVKEEPNRPGNGALVMDENNMNDVIAELNRKAAEGMFQVKMSNEWTFPDGRSASTDAYVANSTANSKPIYFEVSTDDGTIIYTSPVIPVGKAVEKFSLSKPLEAGDYECTCTYYLLNDDESVYSSASVIVRIQVAQ